MASSLARSECSWPCSLWRVWEGGLCPCSRQGNTSPEGPDELPQVPACGTWTKVVPEQRRTWAHAARRRRGSTVAAWSSRLLGDGVLTRLALSAAPPGYARSLGHVALAGRRGGASGAGHSPQAERRVASAPQGAGGLGRLRWHHRDSSACGWGPHTCPLLRPSKGRSAWRLPPNTKSGPGTTLFKALPPFSLPTSSYNNGQ